MKKIFIFGGLAVLLGVALFASQTILVYGQAFNQDGDDCFMSPADERCDTVIYSPRGGGGGMSSGGSTTTTTTEPRVVGSLNFSPGSVVDGGSFSIRLSGAESIPTNTVTRLWIDPENTGSFKNFGTWLTVGELRSGISRKLTCSSYSSYDPSGAQNISGKKLNQRIFISYEGLGYGSEISLHTKDCSSSGSGTTGPSSPSGGSSGSAACLVSPGSISISQGGTANLSVSTSRTSTSGDLVYVNAIGFPTGSYSSLGNGQVIDAGKNKKDFQVFSTNNANRGSAQFTVYCSTGCPVSGCPSGGTAEILGSAQISISVTGNNPEPTVGGGSPSGGSGSGSDACRVGSLILPSNSSDRTDIGFDATENNISFSATPVGSGISSVSAYPNIKIARVQNGSGREVPIVHVKTSSDFSGQSSYNLACNYENNRLTAVGSISAPAVSNPAGKVKLSQMEDLKEVLFPSSVCNFNVKGCRSGFFSRTPLFVMANATPPALVGADMIALSPAPAKGNTAHPRLFNLADPMRPTDSGLSGQIRAGGDYDTAGDFGAYLAIEGAAYSKDKTIWAGLSSQGVIYVWKDGKRYEDWGGSGSRQIYGIIKYGFSYILLTHSGSYDITNGMTNIESGIDSLSGNMWRRDRLNSAPAGFPDMPRGEKIILGDDKHILAVFTGAAVGQPAQDRKLAIYAADSSGVVAEQILPPAEGSETFGTVPVQGGEYLYVLRAPKYTSAMDRALYGPQFATVYKFDYATKKITEIAKDVALAPGYVSANAAFGANTANPGIVVSSFTYSTGFDIQESKIQVYLISDLAQGKGIDSLSNSPVWKDNTHRMMQAASLTVGGATYVYSDDARVYKLEMGTATGGSTNPPTTIPPTGGSTTSTVPTYDCGFDLSFTPTDLSVKQGTYYANYTIKANSTSVNPFCTINVIPPSQNSIRSDYVSTLLVSPGGQATMLLNVSKAAKGTYALPVKAAAKGVPTKTYTVNLTVY